MPKDPSHLPRHNSQTRILIAQAAARLMAEHGIRDFAFAKRKAARQLGVDAKQTLPSNEEIETALHDYHALFDADEHQACLSALRRQASQVMRDMERFQPMLTGGLVSGVATCHSSVELEIHADSSKEFEHFLLNQGIQFKTEERRGQSCYTLFADPADVMVTVLPPSSAHGVSRNRDGTPRRLTLAQLDRLLAEEEDAASTRPAA